MPRILVVDDDEALCGLIEYKLKQKGHEVAIAFDGQQALDQMNGTKYDVLVLDIMMPKVDGFYLLREIQKSKTRAPRATIILSARREEEDILKSFEMGAIDYVAKPFSLNVLVARIELALKFKASP